jgi:hypothetical protein
MVILLWFYAINTIASKFISLCDHLKDAKLMHQRITLSASTLEDHKSVEYQWVRSLYVSGYEPHEINHYIQSCFGGDDVFANLFRKVALHQENLYVLLQYLGLSPSRL